MATSLVCWKCGASLSSIALPIGRLARCPACRAELHVCRLCRHYNASIYGMCREDRADKVLDKECANFCTYFRPRRNAYTPPDRSALSAAKAELDALFASGTESPNAEPGDDDAHDRTRCTRDALDKLFSRDR